MPTCDIFLHIFLSHITNRKYKEVIKNFNLLSMFNAKMNHTKHPKYRNRLCAILSEL